MTNQKKAQGGSRFSAQAAGLNTGATQAEIAVEAEEFWWSEGRLLPKRRQTDQQNHPPSAREPSVNSNPNQPHCVARQGKSLRECRGTCQFSPCGPYLDYQTSTVADLAKVIYNPDMLPVAVDTELMRDPFVPVRIHVSDGHSYVIRNPNLCLITRGALYIARVDGPLTRLADDMDVVDMRHITRIEQVVEESADA